MGTVFRREAVPGEIRELRRWVSRYWRQFPSLKRFLAEHTPEEWERIQECRFSYRVYESKDRPGRYKVTPHACWRVPWCVLCTKVQNGHRTVDAMNRFSCVTPAGKEPRFVHVVMTAPLTEDGEGWGAQASEDVAGFASVVRKSLADLYGPGIGGVMSYQDFGERAFAKRHPHMDLTLNGWLIDQDSWRPLSRASLEGQDYDRFAAVTAKHAQSLALGAGPSNFRFSRIVTGRREYWKVLRYQLREMIDLRKVEYRDGRVEWKDYKTARRTRFSVFEFLQGVEEYQMRLGQHGVGSKKVELHRGFGHMRKAALRRTQELVGGEPAPHGRGCPCSTCEDWERVYDDLGQSPNGRERGL